MFTTQLSDVTKLKQPARRLGYVRARGPDKGEGSIRQLLEAMIAGEVTPVRREPTSDANDAVLAKLETEGLIIRARASRAYRLVTPVKVEGEAVSEMVICARR